MESCTMQQKSQLAYQFFSFKKSITNADLSHENLCRVLICIENFKHKYMKSPFLEKEL